VPERPPLEEPTGKAIFLPCGRSSTQLMRDSLGSAFKGLMHRRLAIVLLLVASAPAARAQEAKPFWPPCSTRVAVQQAFDQASLILAGRVVQSYDYHQRLIAGTSRTSWRMHQVVLEVLRGWKGQPRDTVTFTTPPPDEDSGTARFEPHAVYLVYLRSDLDAAARSRESTTGQAQDLLWNHPDFIRCSRTAQLTEAPVDLRFLGKPLWTRNPE